jgi:PAS domain S-box-containing protein
VARVLQTDLLWMGLFTALYYAAGRLGLSLAFVNASASAVWPPTGIALAALLLLGRRAWPIVAIGAFLVNFTTSGSVAASVVIAAGNTLEALVGTRLIQRFAGGVAFLDRTPDILRFALVVMCATAIAATVGVATLTTAGLAAVDDAVSIWLTWWLGDAVGAVVVTPLLLLWKPPIDFGGCARRAFELLALAVSVIVVSWGLFGSAPSAVYPLWFFLIPVLLWSAFRFGARETATASALVATIATEGTLRSFGPFARGNPNESLLLVQAFIGVTEIMMLSVAAEVKRRRISEAELRSLNLALEARVAARAEELMKVNDRLVEAQQVAHVGSWEWDVASNELWWSEEMYRIYGLSPSDVTGYEAFLGRVHPEDREKVNSVVRRAIVDGRAFTFEHRIVRADGAIRVLYAAGRVVMGDQGRPVRMTGIGHDITERKKDEEARAALILEQAARHEAEEVNRAKDTFLAALSHEIRTPLNAALGWAHTLRVLPPGDPRAVKATEAICRNLTSQAKLVADIMDASRLSRGRLQLQVETVDVASLIDAAIETVGGEAAARTVTIDTQIPDVPVHLVADGKRLQQVLWNLLSNAVTFGKAGGHVRVIVTADDEAVSIGVEDDGPGIDPAFLPHIFEQFRQGDELSPRTIGLGLGLSIARQIVEQHGGTIGAANRPEGGSVFIVRLPLRVSQPHP